MDAATDWSNAELAGALVIGAVAATFATVRIMRYLLEYLRRERDSGGAADDD